MNALRVALAQINTTVGEIDGNVRKIVRAIHQARDADVGLIAFPELAIPGYPPEDLLLKPSFLEANRAALNRLAAATYGLTVVVGFADADGDVYNAAAVLHDGQLVEIYRKHYLPTYGVFDEDRTFRAGQENVVFAQGDALWGVSICEDIWYPGGPPRDQARAGAQLLINISASPYHASKGGDRERMLATRAADNVSVVAFCNLVGGQDELVFEGRSVVIDASGDVVARGAQFEEDLVIADVDLRRVFRRRLHDPRRRKLPTADLPRVMLSPGAPSLSEEKSGHALKARGDSGPWCQVSEPLTRLEEVYGALTLGLADYVRKNGFDRVVIGLSGGIDSALTACVAADALGSENVTGVAMPSRYSADFSETDAARLAENLGIDFLVIPIEQVFQAYLDTLDDVFPGEERGVTEENLQARTRGNLLMALSNRFGWMVVTTGNKSEMSVGYATLYGDMAGGFALIKDVPKTLVYELSRWRNGRDDGPVIPERVLTRPPSAELRPDQEDTDSLPPYEKLDPILEAYVEQDMGLQGIVALGYDESLVRDVIQMVDQNEYKRRQAPPGVRITARAFGKDRRLPITNGFQAS
jgi:NAD+ synthase (glutamine-hydrolysing)